MIAMPLIFQAPHGIARNRGGALIHIPQSLLFALAEARAYHRDCTVAIGYYDSYDVLARRAPELGLGRDSRGVWHVLAQDPRDHPVTRGLRTAATLRTFKRHGDGDMRMTAPGGMEYTVLPWSNDAVRLRPAFVEAG